MVTAAMKLRDTCSLKKSYDKHSDHIKKLLVGMQTSTATMENSVEIP